MRKAIFVFFLLLGVGAGYLPARNDDWGLRIVMMAVGALFGGRSVAVCRGLASSSLVTCSTPRRKLSRFRAWACQVEISQPTTGAMKAIHNS